MAGKTKEERLKDIHAEALEEFDLIHAALRDERLQCLEDRRFYSIAGAQWEGPLGEQFEARPKYEFNKVHLSVIRIINEYRSNRITVDFTPKDGSTKADLADVCDGLYRADEQDSGAQEAYDNCFEEGVGGGFGALWLKTRYEDEDDDDDERQRICIEPIFDADTSVFFDLDAKRQDKADAKRCFVLVSMTHKAFFREFGHDPATWPKPITKRQFDWCTPAVVYVAHYYRVEETSEIVHIFRGLDGVDMKVPHRELVDDENKLDELTATGFREVGQKRIRVRKVHKYILSGQKVEEDEGYIVGKHIPVIPFYGKRWFVDNIERCMGHVRLAKDAQRLQNSLLSWLTEMAARFDMEKPILSPEQIAGHATMWAEDNIKRYPYLLANMLKDLDGNPIPGSQAPVAYTKAPQVPPAMAALIQIASTALDDLLGNQQAGEQIEPNLSGKAVELIQQRLDMQVYIYMSNFAKTIKRVGEVWLSMAREVFIEDGRKMKTVGQANEIDTITLRQPAVSEDGEEYLENNLDEASFDVFVDVGPSSSSKRQATVRALTGMAQFTEDPQDRKVLIGSAIQNIEGEGLQDVRDYYRRNMIRMGVTKPTDDELAELQQEQANTPPDPQAAALMGMAEQAQADAALARAKTVDAIAHADLNRAQARKTLAETAQAPQEQALATFDVLHKALQAQQPRMQ